MDFFELKPEATTQKVRLWPTRWLAGAPLGLLPSRPPQSTPRAYSFFLADCPQPRLQPLHKAWQPAAGHPAPACCACHPQVGCPHSRLQLLEKAQQPAEVSPLAAAAAALTAAKIDIRAVKIAVSGAPMPYRAAPRRITAPCRATLCRAVSCCAALRCAALRCACCAVLCCAVLCCACCPLRNNVPLCAAAARAACCMLRFASFRPPTRGFLSH